MDACIVQIEQCVLELSGGEVVLAVCNAIRARGN